MFDQHLRNKKRRIENTQLNTLKKKKLFTFEELVSAELKVLKKCLKPGGRAETGAQEKYGSKPWFQRDHKIRKEHGLPPLRDMEAECYGHKVSSKVPRKQWEQLIDENPDKILKLPNLQLVESIVGRGLYVLPLEWWYVIFGKENIFVVCSEDLRKNTAESVSRVSDFLGLPKFDFNDVVSEGMFNVGGHKGYDTLTNWNSTQQKSHFSLDSIPISDALKQEFSEFVQPFNDRLFELTGTVCNW